MDQQIAAVRAALAAVESAITQTEAALNASTVPQDIVALRSVLVDLKAERTKLKLQLANLEAAAVEVQPLGGPRRARVAAAGPGRRTGVGRMPAARRTQMKALEKELKSAVADRSVAKAAITLASKVMTSARRLRAMGDDEAPAPIRRAAGKRATAGGGARRRRS